MKVSFLINRPPPFVGGLQNVCWRVAKHFQESVGARVRIIGFPDRDNSSSSGEELAWEHEGVAVHELSRGRREDLLLRWVPFLKKRRATFPLAIACYEWAYSRQISRLCHGSTVFHYFGTGMEMNGYPVARVANKIGAMFFIDPALHAGTWGDTWLDTPLYRMADRMFTYSEFEKSVLLKLGISEKNVKKVLCGLEFRNDGNAGRFLKKNGIDGPCVLFLGRKTVSKGVGRLLEAWPMVAKKCPEATLVLAGPKSEALRQMADPVGIKIQDSTGQDSGWRMADGEAALQPRTDVGERIADSNLPATSHSLPVTAQEARVLNLDDLSESEKQDALAACDILCVPSEGESFGMVYYEAWAYKKPVVALDLPVLRESIDGVGGGVLAESNPKNIANAVIKLLSEPELCREKGSRGYMLALQHDWPKALESYSEAYREAGVKL